MKHPMQFDRNKGNKKQIDGLPAPLKENFPKTASLMNILITFAGNPAPMHG